MNWEPPSNWHRFFVIDVHTGGEPLRVIVQGFPPPAGATMLEKRRDARDRFDGLRRTLMWEPRGHADMYGCLLTEPVTPDGDAGVLFMHNQGFSTMCGHGVIGVAKVGLECGLLLPREPGTLRLDTPAGRVTAYAEMRGDRVGKVVFDNVPSFVLESDVFAEVEGWGSIRGDIAFGGAFYFYVDARDLGLSIEASQATRIVRLGQQIKKALLDHPIRHPVGEKDLNFLYGVIFVEELSDSHSRNACVFADGELDRSPTGTGVSGRAAIQHRKRGISPGQILTVEGIIGSSFEVQVVEETRVADLEAVIPRVSGTAHIVGKSEILVDPMDPFGEGFFLRC